MAEMSWQRSSFSPDGGNNCVEVATATSTVALRESDAPAEVLTTSRGALLQLIRAVKAGAGPVRPPRP